MPAQSLKVTYLLAVWGESYIRQFMDMSLRSLLASGNIPAVSTQADSRFIFLTRESDRELFTSHPLYKRLERHAQIEFVSIDDLIFDGNYSATLTLAYERGMRHIKQQMLSTYFIYLVADYVMANGSLFNLLPHMQNNVSAITAGNFQVIEEDVLAVLKKRIDRTTGVLSIAARELMGMSLPYLHPLTIANTVNHPYSHTDHTNRLFWRVDQNTLVGRFYLRHMLAIKPEIDNYVIGSSCDYSFIAEMCPSGNVAHIADSDEYLVIELQPFTKEEHFIKPGEFHHTKMVQSLGAWTTSQQRNNAFYPVIYHSDEITKETLLTVESSLEFIESIDRQLPEQSQPVSGHPYWISCIEGVLAVLATSKDRKKHIKHEMFAGIIGSSVFEPPLGHGSGDYHLLKTERYRYGHSWRRTIFNLVHRVAGSEAIGHIWHRDSAHSSAIKKSIQKTAVRNEPFLFISYESTSYVDWCHEQFSKQAIVQQADLFESRTTETLKAFGATNAVILLPTTHMHKLGELLNKCNRCLAGDKHVTIIVMERYFSRKTHLSKKLAVLAAYYQNPAVEIESFSTITNPMRRFVDGLYQQQLNKILQQGISPWALAKRMPRLIALSLISALYAVGNILSTRRHYPHTGEPTCAIFSIRLANISTASFADHPVIEALEVA